MEYSNEKYLLVINGKPQGPFTIEELRGLRVKPTDFVRSAGMDDYKEAHEVAELRQLLGIAKQPIIPQYFGSFEQRLLASVLDWVFVSAGFIFIALIAVMFVKGTAARWVIVLSLAMMVPVAKLIYHVIMESSPKQGTYGKQLLKIRICNMIGERITAANALGRNLAKAVSVLTFFIGYLLCFFTKQQQCLHDIMADTLVVKERLM